MSILAKKQLKMSKIRSKKHKKKLFSLIFVFVFCILFFLLIINISDIFSSLITNKGSLFYQKKLETQSYIVYSVSLENFDNIEEANLYAVKTQQQGGAGFVYESGEKYVLVSSYPTLSQAKEIKENLTNLGYNSKVLNLKVDELLIDYKGDNSALFLESLNFFKSTYQKLQSSTISFDKQSINQKELNSILASMLTQLSQLQSNMQTLSQSQDLVLKDAFSVPLDETKKLIEELFYFVGEDNIYTSKLKQTAIKIVISNKNLVNKINAMQN